MQKRDEKQTKSWYIEMILYLLPIAYLLIVIGTYWDISWHNDYGREDWLWYGLMLSPPHYMMYAGLIISTAIAVLSYVFWSRNLKTHNKNLFPYFIIIFIGLFVKFVAVPIDSIWHAVYGPDVRPDSFNHLLILFGALLENGGFVLLLRKYFVDLRDITKLQQQFLLFLVTSFVLRLTYAFSSHEYDVFENLVKGTSPIIFPGIFLVITISLLLFWKHLFFYRWSSTTIILLFTVVRFITIDFSIIIGMKTTLNMPTYLPVLLIAAVLIDVYFKKERLFPVFSAKTNKQNKK